MYDGEPFRIGMVTSPDMVPCFKRACPQALWYWYASLADCSQQSEQDGVDMLIVDLMYLECSGDVQWEAVGVLCIPVASTLLETLSAQYALVVVLDPEHGLTSWIKTREFIIFGKPVDATALKAALAAHADRIQRTRLRRLFRKVADTFTSDATP
jgi:hypothetical protein